MPAVPTVRSPSRQPERAPALYVIGYAAGCAEPESVFRLPCPPRWDDRALGALAAEGRVRKAYCGTLDALRTGIVDAERFAKLTRLAREVRSETARAALEQLRRVQRFVRWSGGGWPVVPTPATPLDRIVVTAPALRDADRATDAELAQRYAWTLDWLRMHRWIAGRGVTIEWRVLTAPTDDRSAELAVAVEPGARVSVPVPARMSGLAHV